MKRIRNIVKILMVGLASVFLVVWSLPVEAVNGGHEGPSKIYIAKSGGGSGGGSGRVVMLMRVARVSRAVLQKPAASARVP